MASAETPKGSAAAAFAELFERMPDLVRDAVDELDADTLAKRPAEGANTIAWLVWHLSRIEDDHISSAADRLGRSTYAEQAWPDFVDRFALPLESDDHGFGHTPEQVAQVRAEGALLAEYYEAVHAKTQGFLGSLDAEDWDTVVDEDWEPPVTVLARVTSVANEVAQHVGQAAFVRGIVAG